MKTYRNRYGDTYYYEPVGGKTFKFVMEGDSMQWCRSGGKEGQQEIDMNDLGMFDPSGGPYIELGMTIPVGKVKRISSTEDGFLIEVE